MVQRQQVQEVELREQQLQELAQELEFQPQRLESLVELEPVPPERERLGRTHHQQSRQALLRQEQFDQLVQQFFVMFLQQVKEFLYQLCQLKLLGVVHQRSRDHLRLLTNE